MVGIASSRWSTCVMGDILSTHVPRGFVHVFRGWWQLGWWVNQKSKPTQVQWKKPKKQITGKLENPFPHSFVFSFIFCGWSYKHFSYTDDVGVCIDFTHHREEAKSRRGISLLGSLTPQSRAQSATLCVFACVWWWRCALSGSQS